VKNYLELQKIRFKNKFEYSTLIDQAIPRDMQVPKMIIHSYAENAIKHGLMHRVKDGKLNIDVERRDACIIISVEDNGIGREKAAELNTNSTGLGLKMMTRIISLYRKLFQTEISQSIEDLTDDAGNPAGTREVVTVNLGRVEEMLTPFTFYRNSCSVLINTAFLKKADRQKRKCLLEKGTEKIWLDIPPNHDNNKIRFPHLRRPRSIVPHHPGIHCPGATGEDEPIQSVCHPGRCPG
jgi:hypothetical protein